MDVEDEEVKDCPLTRSLRTGQMIGIETVICVDRAAHESIVYSQQPYSSCPTSWSTAPQSLLHNFDYIFPISRTKESWDHPMNQSTNRPLEEKIKKEYGRGVGGGGMLGGGTERLVPGVLHTLGIRCKRVCFQLIMSAIDDVSASVKGKEGLSSLTFNLWKKELKIHPMFRMGAESGIGTTSILGAATTSVKGASKMLLLGALGRLFKIPRAAVGGGARGAGSDDDNDNDSDMDDHGGGGSEGGDEGEEEDLLLPIDADWILQMFCQQLAKVRELLPRVLF